MTFYDAINLDTPVKIPDCLFFVIPAQAGIQEFQALRKTLDTGRNLSASADRCDDFLRRHQP